MYRTTTDHNFFRFRSKIKRLSFIFLNFEKLTAQKNFCCSNLPPVFLIFSDLEFQKHDFAKFPGAQIGAQIPAVFTEQSLWKNIVEGFEFQNFKLRFVEKFLFWVTDKKILLVQLCNFYKNKLKWYVKNPRFCWKIMF